jgi:hypothetical protein
MSEEELRSAIERPAAVDGLRLEPGLADTILADVAGQPRALPLMSHALLETYARRRGAELTLSGYHAAGGVSGAIAQTADAILEGLSSAEQALARSIFLRLIEIGKEGSQDARRRVAPSELVRTNAEAQAVEGLLQTLADARLVITSENSVEVAHKALSCAWPVLRVWLDEEREGQRIHRHLSQAAGEWQRLGRDTSELYCGARLAAADVWADEHVGALNPLEQEFLAASRELASRQEVEREVHQRRELDVAQSLARELEKRALAEWQRAEAEAQRAEAERQRAEEQAQAAGQLRQRTRLLTWGVAVAAILALLALLAVLLANRSTRSAWVASTHAVANLSAAETAQVLEAGHLTTAKDEGWTRATQQEVAVAEADSRANQEALDLVQRGRDSVAAPPSATLSTYAWVNGS